MLSKDTPMFRLIVPLAPDFSMLMDRSPPSTPSTQTFNGDNHGTLYSGSREGSSHASIKRQDMWADESGLLCLLLDEAIIHFLLFFLSFLVNRPSNSYQHSYHFLYSRCLSAASFDCVEYVNIRKTAPKENTYRNLLLPSKNSAIISLYPLRAR